MLDRKRIAAPTGALCVLLCLTVLLASLGCLTPGSPSAAAGQPRSPRARPAAERSITVTWSFWGSAWSTEINRRVARAFEAEHPGIRVELVHRPWEEYFTWLADEWAAGRSPDVMMINYVPTRARHSMLANLTPWLARDRVDLLDFYPQLLEQFRYYGALYGLPRDNDTKVIYYNKRAFDAARLRYPQPGWTWEDLRALARALTVRGADGQAQRYGFAFEAAHWWRLWVWQNAADLVDDPFRPREFRLDSPEGIEALEYLAGLAAHDHSTPPPELLNTAAMTQLFDEGRLAMVLGNHALVPFLAENPDLDWDVAGLPRGRLAANFAGGAGYSLSRVASDPEAAWQLLKFLTGPAGQALFAESGLITPARRSVREDNIFLRRQPYNRGVFLEETARGRPNLHARRSDDLNAALDRALWPVWLGERTVAEALAAVRPEVERLLAEE